MQGQCNDFYKSLFSTFISFLVSSLPDFLVLLNEVDCLSICIKRFGHLSCTCWWFSPDCHCLWGFFFPYTFLIYICFLNSSLKYFWLHNLRIVYFIPTAPLEINWMVCQCFCSPWLLIPALLVYQIVILGSMFLCEHHCTSPHFCLARLINARPLSLSVLFSLKVACNGVMDSFVPLHPFFTWTGLKTMYVFGFCGSKNACVLHNLS